MTVNKAWNIWNFRRNLVADLLSAGARVTVLAARDDYVDSLRHLGCDFVDLNIDSKGMNPLREFALLWRLRRLLAHLRPDVILSFTVKNNIYGALAANALRIPIIPNVTGLGTAFLSGAVLKAVVEGLYRYAFGRAPTIFFQNEEDLQLFVERKLARPQQARLVPGSGIDLDQFGFADMPDTRSGITYLMVARLLRDKGVLEFVEAAQEVRARFPGTRFLLLGPESPDNRSALTLGEIRAADRSGVIEYMGAVPDVRPLIGASHCVVLPSYREGAPRVLIEASAMGRPLIATDVPGCRAIVFEGDNGHLCKARDARDLARCMIDFLRLEHIEKVNMGIRARERVERNLSVARVIDAYRTALADAGVSLR